MSKPPELNIRCHVHDLRNHLNGLEMDALFLADLFPDPSSEAHQISQRIKKELARIDSTLRGMTACFAKLDIESISVSDLFQLWKSRSSRFVSDDPVVWNCRVDGGFIDVDGRVVADLLSFLVGTAISKSNAAVEASVYGTDGGATFEIKTVDGDCINVSPEYIDAIERNGGSVESAPAVDGTFLVRISFPDSEAA